MHNKLPSLTFSPSSKSRRRFLQSGLALATSLGLPVPLSASSAELRKFHLRAQPGVGYLRGGPLLPTRIWCYNDRVPGPVIRVRQGERLHIELANQLDQVTTLHCHGIRLPNDMDGVPDLTQSPVKSGESFVYEFDAVDAGTFWYHPHANSSEQVGRGLHGALIVEEAQPPKVDKDLLWLLDDWRLNEDMEIRDDFQRMGDKTHAGRLGNFVTVNGITAPDISVRTGERVRIRLINVANARTFALDFSAHRPQVIAIDGQPVIPHEPADGRVILGAAMRMDIIIDMFEAPGTTVEVQDNFYRGERFKIARFKYQTQSPLREQPLASSVQLAPNPIPEPDIENATRHDIVLAGGAMGRMRSAILNGKRTNIREMVNLGLAWAMNDVVGTMENNLPLLELQQGKSYILILKNETVFPHPMHLHGYAFRVITRNGEPVPNHVWQDTVLLMRGDSVEIAFVADNPGKWMFHCHILEHQEAGMTSVVNVA